MNKHISQIAGLFVIAIACLVLLGWQFDITLLKAGFRGLTATMKANTAICFLFAGISLILLQYNPPTRTHHRISKLFAGAIAVIGLMTLSEYLFSWDLNIDELFFRDVISSATPYPGRMGINTALNFILMGAALVLLGQNSRRNIWIAHICSSSAALISLLSLVGYLFEVDIATRLVILKTAQALHTSLTFLILYIGILSLRPDKGLMQVMTSSLVGGEMARRLLPWAIVFPIALNWFTFRGRKLGMYDIQSEYILQITFEVLTFSILIWGTAQYLNHIDLRRKQSDLSLKKINETLEALVSERIEALRNSEKQFRNAFENAPIGKAIVGLNGQFIKVNAALCEIVGYTPEELLALTFHDITHPDDLEIDVSYARQLLSGEISTYQIEKQYFHQQGYIVWVLLNGSLVRDEQGNPLQFIAQIQDITARKISQKELELQSQIIHNMAGGVALIKASDLIIEYTNPKFDSMFGYAEGELIGQPVSVVNYVDTEVTPDVSVMDIVEQIDRYGEAKYEVHNKKKDDTLFWCRVHTSRFEHPEYGGVYVAVQEDVTELKLAEQALQTSTNRLHFLLNYSPVVIFGCEPGGDYGATFISENIKDLLGYEPKEFLEDSEFWTNHIHPEDVERVFKGIAEPFINDFYSHEYRLLHSDGDYRWMLAQLKLIRDSAGRPTELLGYLIDISDRKHTELLQQEKEEAEAANRAKSIFLSNMSHELRTPLNSILGFTQLMLNENSLSPSSQERLQIITRSGEYLLDLINDILNLSKIESGRMTLNNSEFDLIMLLTSLEEMLRVKVEPKKFDLIFEPDPNLPRFIYADEKKLYQVLVNLLGNAIKFTNQGSVILRARAESKDKTCCNLYFEIKDTGVGIAPEEIDMLFKVFVQAQAGNNLNQGTGLGLAISQKIMQLMGSQIQVQSTLNQGSTFSFEIEVQLPQVAIFTSKPLNQRVIGLAPNQLTYRILVVEDLVENRLLLVETLTSIGFEVREATHGIEAIALWKNWFPHLILMDLRMPFMDGYTATKCIRENPKSQETIIIALTASVFEEDREKVLNVGCNDFIRKPFQQKELFEKIATHLGVKYICQTIEESPKKTSAEILSIEALSEMSPEWLEEMYQAAYYLDTDVMNELIAQIPKSKSSLAKALTDSINNFNSDRIMELIQSLGHLA